MIAYCQTSLPEIQTILENSIIELPFDLPEIASKISESYEDIVKEFIHSVSFDHIRNSEIRKIRA